MYQGKFDSKNRKTSVDVSELVAQRNAAPARKAAPAREQASASRNPAPTKKQAPVAEQAPAKKQAPKKQAPAKKQPAPQPEPERRGPRLGGVIFYTFYFMFILLFFVATYFGLNWLQGWLVDYEAAQPTTKCQQVFDQLFADPDWARLYDMAGIEDTQYEGKEEFVSYMEEKMADAELTFAETSAGLSGDKKYIVKLGDEKVATFTLVGESKNITDIPDWQLGSIELFFEREESYLIQLADGHTAYVNGVELDESFTIQIASTKADTVENFLPLGASSSKTLTQQITGLMALPTVTVKDASGNDMTVIYDEAANTFVEQTEANAMSDEERSLVLNALKAYAEYGIKEATTAKLAKYFDSTGDAYKGIIATVLGWTKGNNGYSFANDSVTGYARYSDTLFSVYATTELTIKLTDGGTQVKPINASLLFEKKNGNWKVVRMTNADVTEPVGEVRLTFICDDEIVDSKFVDNDAKELTTPMVSAPADKVFVGWIAEVTTEEGKTEWQLMFSPDESSHVSIRTGTILEPMTLYAYFENASTAENTEGAE